MKKGYGIGLSALVLCLTGIPAAECSGGMVLAENGKARMCVVADAAEMNRIYPAVYPCKLFETAVKDFRKHLSLATGGDFAELFMEDRRDTSLILQLNRLETVSRRRIEIELGALQQACEGISTGNKVECFVVSKLVVLRAFVRCLERELAPER